MASSVDTPMAGFCAPQASPLAVDTPMRTPVNEPGPRATAMASTSASLVSVFFSICSAIGSSVQLCVRPGNEPSIAAQGDRRRLGRGLQCEDQHDVPLPSVIVMRRVVGPSFSNRTTISSP